MSFQGRLGCWWVRFWTKEKPAGEEALVDFTRRRFRPPAWLVRLHSLGVKIEETTGPVKGEWILPDGASEKGGIVYYIHGGGYISGSAKTNRPITVPLARRVQRRVFSLDYRLAPEDRFPAAIEDVLAGYRWLVSSGLEPGSIAVAGDSAGGGLALALVMALRRGGETPPACVVCLSPWADMTSSSDSLKKNSERDPMFVAEDIERYANVYLGKHSRSDPAASPLLGEFAGLPPLYLQVADTEVLLDDARGLHRKTLAAGGSSELRIFKGVPHGWHFGMPFLPEAREALNEAAEFVKRH
jgi:acetyl esterase/lipase